MALGIDTVINLLNAQWNTGNYSPKPVIKRITDVGTTDVSTTDFILVHESSWSATYKTLTLKQRDLRQVITIDIRTRTRSKLDSIFSEVDRILSSNAGNPGDNYAYAVLEGRQDLSDGRRNFYRYVLSYAMFKIEVIP